MEWVPGCGDPAERIGRGKGNMGPIRRILVAIKDPGAPTLPAVAKAARVARACGAHLELFHALKASVYADERQRRECLQRLARIAARLRLHGIEVSTAVELDYPVYDAIIRHATRSEADLIVVRRHDEKRA